MRARHIVIGIGLLTACNGDPDDTTGTATETGAATSTTGGATVEPTGGTSTGVVTGTSTGPDGTTGPDTGTSGTTGPDTGTSGDTGDTGDTSGGSTTDPAGCIACGEALMGGEKEDLCARSKVLYDELFACVCTACEAECVQACTMGQTPMGACQDCQNMAIGGACSDALNACFSDA